MWCGVVCGVECGWWEVGSCAVGRDGGRNNKRRVCIQKLLAMAPVAAFSSAPSRILSGTGVILSTMQHGNLTAEEDAHASRASFSEGSKGDKERQGKVK